MPSSEHRSLEQRVHRLEQQLQAALMQITTITKNTQAQAETIIDLQSVIRDHLEELAPAPTTPKKPRRTM
jgi:hypothetical protein